MDDDVAPGASLKDGRGGALMAAREDFDFADALVAVGASEEKDLVAAGFADGVADQVPDIGRYGGIHCVSLLRIVHYRQTLPRREGPP